MYSKVVTQFLLMQASFVCVVLMWMWVVYEFGRLSGRNPFLVTLSLYTRLWSDCIRRDLETTDLALHKTSQNNKSFSIPDLRARIHSLFLCKYIQLWRLAIHQNFVDKLQYCIQTPKLNDNINRQETVLV